MSLATSLASFAASPASRGDLDVLLPAIFGLVGAIIGGIAVVGAQFLQHKKTVEHESEKEKRRRAVSAAEEIDRLLITLQSLVPQVADARTVANGGSAQKASSIDRVRNLCVHLPTGLRGRVEQAAALLRDASDFAGDRSTSPHYHSVWTIAGNVVEDTREAIAAFLRNEPLPAENEFILEYAESYRELQDDLEDFYAEEIDSQRETREAWLARHPEVKSEIEKRRTSEGR